MSEKLRNAAKDALEEMESWQVDWEASANDPSYRASFSEPTKALRAALEEEEKPPELTLWGYGCPEHRSGDERDRNRSRIAGQHCGFPNCSRPLVPLFMEEKT